MSNNKYARSFIKDYRSYVKKYNSYIKHNMFLTFKALICLEIKQRSCSVKNLSYFIFKQIQSLI